MKMTIHDLVHRFEMMSLVSACSPAFPGASTPPRSLEAPTHSFYMMSPSSATIRNPSLFYIVPSSASPLGLLDLQSQQCASCTLSRTTAELKHGSRIVRLASSSSQPPSHHERIHTKVESRQEPQRWREFRQKVTMLLRRMQGVRADISASRFENAPSTLPPHYGHANMLRLWSDCIFSDSIQY